MDDALALEALLELSRKLNPKNHCQSIDKKFPLLDKATVESAMGSVAYILENKQKWRIPCTNLVKKWCDVRDSNISCRHLSWMGTDSSLASIDCLLAACNALVDPKSTSNLLCLELRQQQAICLAITCLADKSEKAKKLSSKLFEMVIDNPESVNNHSEFLAEIWKYKEMLTLSLKQIELLVQKCPCGLEKQILGIATNCLQSEEPRADIVREEEDKEKLVNLCLSSPFIFQVTTSIFMQLVQKSQAHEDVVNVMRDFVQRCTSDERNIVKLFPTKCQVALALLSVPPEATNYDNYVGYLLDALADLPPSSSMLLVTLHRRWLPILADKL